MTQLDIRSEIGPLKSVLLHRPGRELERITPDTLQEVLFEDIPWLKRMQEEHDAFAGELSRRGVNVLYVEDLLEDVLQDPAVRKHLIDQALASGLKSGAYLKDNLREYLEGLSPAALREALIAGVVRKDLDHIQREPVLADLLHTSDPYAFCLPPLPNLYFMRDPAVVIGSGMAVSAMHAPVRRRESLIMQTLLEHHPYFKGAPNDYGWNEEFSIEGGDVLILNEHVVAIGISQRTSIAGAEKLAHTLFEKNPQIEKVLAVKIPEVRAFMHLDTVFTMVDYDKFTVYPGILDNVETVTMTRGKDGTVHFAYETNLNEALKKALGLGHITLIESGGGNPLAAVREQWNDSTNTFALAPGKVVAYSRNERSNAVLEKNGIEVIPIEGSELVRGRGGPRCMTMPLAREGITWK